MSAFTRRGFLNMVGAAGGSVAVYQVAMGLGLIPMVAGARRRQEAIGRCAGCWRLGSHRGL
jgi:hypothetical protein